MLIDIFATRYSSISLWETFNDAEKRFLVQAFRIVSEQLYPYWTEGKESSFSKEKWTGIHDKLSMELGLMELSPRGYSYQIPWLGQGQTTTSWASYTMDKVCQNFVCAKYDGSVPADRFMKERVSFFELAFREKENNLHEINQNLQQNVQEAKLKAKLRPTRGVRIPGDPEDAIRAYNQKINHNFRNAVEELNERFRQAGCNLNYHNGYIQISDDALVEEQIEKEFWRITHDPMWQDVDIDMKEAIDLRDSNGRDPVSYAARALESTIKIISDQKGWTRGNERGAHNYIENLNSKPNGQFITDWEANILKAFFTSVRNPISHGAGSNSMPKLTPQQTDWSIETCMSWIKNLIKRM